MRLSPGSVFAGYRIEAVAGRGGMGIVYLATELALERPVALKLVADQLAFDSSFSERFERESRLAASIDHPNVIPVYGAGEEHGTLYIAMRYVEGTDLRALLAAAGALEHRRAAHMVAQIGQALDAAHARGLVHRDVKPANILIAERDHAYLTDFGLTKRSASDSGLTRTGEFVGTLDYIAPEQLKGERVDARSDVYALGCVLYEALTGSVPFPTDTDAAKLWAHMSDPPPSVAAARPDAPLEFEEVVRRALAKDPGERYPSAGDLGQAVLAASEGRPLPKLTGEVATGAAAGEADDETVGAAVPVVSPPEGEGALSASRRSETGETPPRFRRRARQLGAVGAVLALGIGAMVVIAGGNEGASDESRVREAIAEFGAAPAARRCTILTDGLVRTYGGEKACEKRLAGSASPDLRVRKVQIAGGAARAEATTRSGEAVFAFELVEDDDDWRIAGVEGG